MGSQFNRRNAPAPVGGVVPGSAANKILLALRAGGMSGADLHERLHAHSLSDPIIKLHKAGLIKQETHNGWPGFFYQITPAGLALVQPDGPLSYRAQPAVLAHSDLL